MELADGSTFKNQADRIHGKTAVKREQSEQNEISNKMAGKKRAPCHGDFTP